MVRRVLVTVACLWSHAAGAQPRLRELHPVLVGAFGGGAGAFARMPVGFTLGAETGLATLVTNDADTVERATSQLAAKRHGLALGVSASYLWANGLAVQARFDDLGVHTAAGAQSLMFTTVGLRYSLPFVVMPFVDALAGLATDSSGAAVGVGIGAGVSVLITRHLGTDLAVRDWIADLDGSIRHVPTVTLGVRIGFGR